jgi:hypothetical protein
MYRIIVGLFITILFCPIFAKPYLTVECEAPKGNRIDYEKGKMVASEDGMSGINPLFIFDDNQKDKVTVIWGHSKKLNIPAKAIEATIVVNDEEFKITAMAIDGEVVYMYSLFPKEGVVMFTQHRWFMGIPNSCTFWAKATFNYTKNP